MLRYDFFCSSFVTKKTAWCFLCNFRPTYFKDDNWNRSKINVYRYLGTIIGLTFGVYVYHCGHDKGFLTYECLLYVSAWDLKYHPLSYKYLLKDENSKVPRAYFE